MSVFLGGLLLGRSPNTKTPVFRKKPTPPFSRPLRILFAEASSPVAWRVRSVPGQAGGPRLAQEVPPLPAAPAALLRWVPLLLRAGGSAALAG